MIKLKSLIALSASKPPLKTKLLLLVLISCFIPQIIISYRYADESLMQDFHSRIVGSRLMSKGHSAYHISEPLQATPEFYDPNILLPYQLNGVTATPPFLWLQQPLAMLSYCEAKLWWWIIEEGLLFATLLLTCLIAKSLKEQLLTIVIAICFFCYSRNWWQHIYSGQYYIVFTFLFALCSWSMIRKKNGALVMFPVAALVRPFFLLAALPWLEKNTKSNIMPLLLGIAISVVLFFASGSYKQLNEYSTAMKLYSSEVTGWNGQTVGKRTIEPASLEACVFKANDENGFNAGCLFSLQHYLKLLHVDISNPVFFTAFLLLFLFAFMCVTGSTTLTSSIENILLTSFLIYIFTELFTPANRNPYNLVQYLAVVGVMIRKGAAKPILLFVLGLALNHDLPLRFVYQREIGEAIMLLAIYWAILSGKPNKNKVSLSIST